MKLNKNFFGLLLSLLLVSTLFSACNPTGGEVTTDSVTESTPETSFWIDDTESPETSDYPPETQAPETEETTIEETTAEEVPETTVIPEIYETYVYIYWPDGDTEKITLKPEEKLNSAILAEYVPVSGDIRLEVNGWEYSIGKDGERKAYDLSNPTPVPLEGMHLYPIVEKSYRVRFSAGIGSFLTGISPEIYITEGESFRVADLFSEMPYRADDDVYTYTFGGFACDGKKYAIGDSITVLGPMDLEAFYSKKELLYTVKISTEFGELIGGGKEQVITCDYFSAVKLIESYDSYTSENVYFHDATHEYSGIDVLKTGREWTVTLIWKHIDIRFTVTFDYGEGQTAIISQISAGGKVIIPTGARLSDAERYYDFVGWRDGSGQLYNSGYELTVNENMTLYAEYVPGERRVYTVTFDTELGSFADGSPILVLTGYYGDPLVPPTLDDVTLFEVVYKFAGWGADVPAAFGEDIAFTAVYTTEKPVYLINYYVDGDLYLTERHYAGTSLLLPSAPETEVGMIFCGFLGVPELMPEADLDIYAETRYPKVIYILDGEEVSSQQVQAGTVVAIAAPAQKHGYTVSGWSTSDIGELSEGGFVMPALDVTFRAVSTPNKHTVKYILDGVEIYSDSVVFGEFYTVRGIEVRLGYEFSGWKSQEYDLESMGNIFTVRDGDVVFFAEFEKCSYKVNYYLEDELIYSDSFFFGDTVTVRPHEEQPGCTFAWSSAGVDITMGTFAMPAGDVDIYGAFSAGDTSIVFIIDGKEYGRIGVVSGQTVDLGMTPTMYGYTFTGWSCEEVDVSSGIFKMPDGDIVLRGSFIPNAHDIFFIDIATGKVINTSHLDYLARFALTDRVYTMAGKVSEEWILLAGHALREGDEYIMPDCDVIFGIVWEECLTLEIDEEYYIPYYELLDHEYGGVRYDEATKTVYISEPSIKAHGESEGIIVVYEYENQ